MPDIPSALTFYAVFLFSTVLHEAGHALAALLGGDRTAYHGGQVSLDPRPHIRREPFGMVILPLLSVLLSGWPMGYASAPYDRRWAFQYPKRAAVMALAGPAGNLLLMVLAAIVIRVGFGAGVFHAPPSIRFGSVTAATAGGVWSAVAYVVSVFFSLNLVLFAFNMIPLPPLDGSAAVPLVLSETATARYQQFLWSQPALVWIGILVAWRVFDVIFQPIFLFFVNLLYPGVHYG